MLLHVGWHAADRLVTKCKCHIFRVVSGGRDKGEETRAWSWFVKNWYRGLSFSNVKRYNAGSQVSCNSLQLDKWWYSSFTHNDSQKEFLKFGKRLAEYPECVCVCARIYIYIYKDRQIITPIHVGATWKITRLNYRILHLLLHEFSSPSLRNRRLTDRDMVRFPTSRRSFNSRFYFSTELL
jgi:hypothetical protein